MGEANVNCDDGNSNLAVDWLDSPLNFTCYHPTTPLLPSSLQPVRECEELAKDYLPQHFCMDTQISYDHPVPTHGNHRPIWPKFGEYKFVPAQRWLHNIEHGAVVMLYHPCTHPDTVHSLRRLVTGCIRKHIITPYTNMPEDRPLALVAWGCRLYMSEVDEKTVVNFIREKGLKGPEVTWYNCGPTVYDASHMGHARTYLTFDILRRVMTDYFGYEVFFVMNITDIDDKIIKRARQNHLYKLYCEENHSVDRLLADSNLVLTYFAGVVEKTTDPDKKVMQEKLFEKLKAALAGLETAVNSKDDQKISSARAVLLKDGKDLLSDWMDSQHGSTVTENKIFAELPRYWEEEYHKDMEALNVLPPDCLTRVSEYVPEVVDFIQKIIVKGYAYESNGSVYFDVHKFDSKPNHHYAKLVPEAFGDTKALAEGEGDLSAAPSEKRSERDFALWKSSKPGEPSWDSPWGAGRPGWHIECSVMASAILGESMDIHSGGYDLKFPHHDNELCQSEAYFGNDCWTRYFLHSGHLTIAGCKMSKSLKNFITIQEALKLSTPRQLRIAFLLHSWKDTLDYSPNTMALAKGYEKTISEFFLTVKHFLRSSPSTGVAAFNKWSSEEMELNRELEAAKEKVHCALCDNIDTRTVLETIRELVTTSNAYIEKTRATSGGVNRQLIRKVAAYITRIFNVFGLLAQTESIGFPTGSSESGDLETLVMPYLNSLATFRDNVRRSARELKAVDILKECDVLRDDVLPDLGVRLEDKENEATVIKLVDKEELRREKEEKKAMEEKKRLEKEKKKAEAAAKAAEEEAQRKIPPSELFKMEADKWSKFDDKGMPTHDAKGEEIPKAQQKKLQKRYDAQEKKYNSYLKTLNNEQ